MDKPIILSKIKERNPKYEKDVDNAINLAKLVSSVLSKFNLCDKKHGFILRLKKDGKHIYKDLLG